MGVLLPTIREVRNSAKEIFLTDQEKAILKYMMNEDRTYETYYLSAIFKSQIVPRTELDEKVVTEKPVVDYLLILSIVLFWITTILHAWLT
jgi:hypothetical protein